MRRYFYIGTVVASALIAFLPVTSAAAASVHVLTTGKANGPAVKPGAVLKASLAKGSGATFTTSLGKLTCAKSGLTLKVSANPAKRGTARETVTAQTFSKCTINVSGVTVSSVTVSNLPYHVTVSDAKGNPVKVSELSKTKPLLTSFTAKAGTVVVSCSFKATTISGSASNKGNVSVFVKQRFTLASGGVFCPASGTFSAAYGPLRDSSVKGSPAVFVN
jgi:hypothetical protein